MMTVALSLERLDIPDIRYMSIGWKSKTDI
jgi:hypothetical protein